MNARPICDKASGIHSLPPWVHCRQPILSYEFHDASVLKIKHRAREHEEGVGALSDHRGECPVEIVGTSRAKELKLQPQRAGGSLCFVQHVSHRALAVDPWMPEHSYTGGPGHGLLEEAQAFGD